jgi:hypothetical protein
MARTLYYWIDDDGANVIRDEEWEEIVRLQHWYNSEFIWTAGRLALKMFTIFPNWDRFYSTDELEEAGKIITARMRELKAMGLNERERVSQLEREQLIIVRRGGWLDGSIVSGLTKVANNEFNAYLVCEFVLKVSRIARDAEIIVQDDGRFIKTGNARFHRGTVSVFISTWGQEKRQQLLEQGRVFSIVNPAKYDKHPRFKTMETNFNDMDKAERLDVLKDWNWLGFGTAYDKDGDDTEGFDLNRKTKKIEFHF